VHCAKDVFMNDKRMKCSLGYLHADCIAAWRLAKKTHSSPPKSSVDSLRDSGDEILSPSPVLRSNRSDSLETSVRLPDIDLTANSEASKGDCAVCRTAVLVTQKRVKNEGGYYVHQTCITRLNDSSPVQSSAPVDIAASPPSSSRGISELSSIGENAQSPATPRVSLGTLPKGVCVHCKHPVISSHERVKCDEGYLHSACIPPFKAALGASPKMESPSPHGRLPTRGDTADSGITDRTDREDSKGDCVFCGKPVLVSHKRVKSAKGYLHHSCYQDKDEWQPK